jgi:geranylgeranyl pyrophosphate synthase
VGRRADVAARGGADAVGACIRAAIRRASGRLALQDLLLALMARPGRALSPDGAAKWPVFVLDTCLALGGADDAGAIAAAAVDFAVAAIDVVDDVIDDEWDPTLCPSPRAVNASLVLAWLAQSCALDLAPYLGAARSGRIAAMLAAGGIASCDGQDLDLLLEGAPDASEDDAHEATVRKSGSLVSMACAVGAAVATDEAAILDVVGTFGRHVGVVAQLLNDIGDAGPDPARRGSDLRRRKKTLPIAYTLRCAREEDIPHVRAWYASSGGPDPAGEQRLAASVQALGGLHYGWVVAEAHRAEALTALRALAQASGRRSVRDLRRLIPATRAQRAAGSGGPRDRPGRPDGRPSAVVRDDRTGGRQ